MKLNLTIFISTLAIGLLYATFAPAQQYPIMDKVADKIIAKYQSSSCEDLKEKKETPKAAPSAEEQKVIQFLKNSPDMRKAFIDKIAAPIANKMFDCGMIP
jgi:hypothetical protein